MAEVTGKRREVRRLPGGRRPAGALGATIWVAAWIAGTAFAHGVGRAELTGTRPCVDARSLELVFEGLDAERRARARAVLHADLGGMPAALLSAAGVALERAHACLSGSDALRLRAEVRYLDPERYRGFGDPAYSYTLTLRVGPPPGVESGAESGAELGVEPDGDVLAPAFVAGRSDIHSEPRDGGPFERQLAWAARELLADLALAWHDDNPARPPWWHWRRWSGPVVGALGAGAVLAGALAAKLAGRPRGRAARR